MLSEGSQTRKKVHDRWFRVCTILGNANYYVEIEYQWLYWDWGEEGMKGS